MAKQSKTDGRINYLRRELDYYRMMFKERNPMRDWQQLMDDVQDKILVIIEDEKKRLKEPVVAKKKRKKKSTGNVFNVTQKELTDKIARYETMINAGKGEPGIPMLLRFAQYQLRAGNYSSQDAIAEMVVKTTKKPPKNKDFYLSREWRKLRYEVLRRNDGKCELCGRSKHDGIVLHVDHIKPRSKYPKLEMDIRNLQILCDDCNIGKSNKDDTDWRQKDG